MIDLADSYLALGQSERGTRAGSGNTLMPAAQGRATLAGLCLRPSDSRQDAGRPKRVHGSRSRSCETRSPYEKSNAQRLATFNTKSLLGRALFGQKKYADAEPLLRAGYEGTKLRAETMSPARKTLSARNS